MSQFIETIRLEDGQFGNLSYHQQRIEVTVNALFPGRDKMDLQFILFADTFPKQGLYKCRITYDANGHLIHYEPYTIRPVISLKRIVMNELSYRYKFADRNELKTVFAQRGQCDDILIIKNGLVTDTSYANIVFKNEEGQWITPSSYLLKGTMRQYLLDSGQIKEQQILSTDLSSFKKFKLINSMLRWDSEERDVSNIV